MPCTVCPGRFKNTLDWVAETVEMCLTVVEAGSLRSRCQHDQVCGESPPRGSQMSAFLYLHKVEKGRSSLSIFGISSYKDTKPIN